MELAIEMAWELGCFHVLLDFGDPRISALMWGNLLAGFLIQTLVLKKCRRRWAGWIFPCLVGLGLVVMEILCQVTTGWDLLVYLIVYAIFVLLLSGAVLASIVRLIRKK